MNRLPPARVDLVIREAQRRRGDASVNFGRDTNPAETRKIDGILHEYDELKSRDCPVTSTGCRLFQPGVDVAAHYRSENEIVSRLFGAMLGIDRPVPAPTPTTALPLKSDPASDRQRVSAGRSIAQQSLVDLIGRKLRKRN